MDSVKIETDANYSLDLIAVKVEIEDIKRELVNHQFSNYFTAFVISELSTISFDHS